MIQFPGRCPCPPRCPTDTVLGVAIVGVVSPSLSLAVLSRLPIRLADKLRGVDTPCEYRRVMIFLWEFREADDCRTIGTLGSAGLTGREEKSCAGGVMARGVLTRASAVTPEYPS